MAAPSNSSLWSFLGKILVLSAVISVAIKYLGPLLALPVNGGVALVLVLSPTVMMSVALAFRAKL